MSRRMSPFRFPCGDGAGEVAALVSLVVDAPLGGFVPDSLAGPLAEDRAGGAQVAEVVAERLLRDIQNKFVTR